MNIKWHVIGYPDSVEKLRAEFLAFIETAKREEWHELEVKFYLEFFQELRWEVTVMSPDELLARVLEVERNHTGRIGSDDLWVTPLATGIEHFFYHENGFEFIRPVGSEYIRSEGLRLKTMGWKVWEQTIDEDIKYKDYSERPPWTEF